MLVLPLMATNLIMLNTKKKVDAFIMNLYDECFKILKGHAVITYKVQNQNFKEKYITGADQTWTSKQIRRSINAKEE